ncbi:MAG: IPT/TIG domain-containing protein [Gemmatimonadetes bacterium]|nr:IPT/TIG domain-containing protein [Gemmatimonadota bacterium]
MMRPLRPLVHAVGTAALLVVAGCGDDPTGPNPADLVIEIRSGNGQIALVASTLPEPLRVVVKERSTGDTVPGVRLEWELVQGTGGVLALRETTSDSTGVATNRLTLGPDPGDYRVRVSLRGIRGTPPEFTATGARTPAITSVPAAVVSAGELILIGGRDFHTDPRVNVVQFSGMRGLVLSASPTELRVTVPICLPSRTVDVIVRIGSLRSDAAQLQVIGGTETLNLKPGDAFVSLDPAVLQCVRLPAIPDSRYLVVSQATATLAGARYPYRLVGLAAARVAASAAPVALARVPALRPQVGEELPGAAHDAWELELRQREGELARIAPVSPRIMRAPAAEPRVGDRTTFNVINKENEFEKVTAEVRLVGRHAVIYQDLNAPSGGFSESDFRAFGAVFDDPIYDTDVAAFGSPSDLDANGRVIILFTPVVNKMTERGSDGFIAGFFFGNDLLNRTGSNRAEIFYTLVPDPDGRFGDARSKERVLRTVPPVLAHELQHMIQFNQRVLLRGAAGSEALWLSEGLAHMAEDMVGEAFQRQGDESRAREFRLANYVRASRFLEATPRTSLVAAAAPGTLAERGAAWLFVKYLIGHFGGNEILRRLTQTTRTGVANVTAETGRAWPPLIGDWSAALYLDDLNFPVEPRFSFPGFELRAAVGQLEAFPLQPRTVLFRDFVEADTLSASAADFLIAQVGTSGAERLHLMLGDATAGPMAADAGAQITIVRLR